MNESHFEHNSQLGVFLHIWKPSNIAVIKFTTFPPICCQEKKKDEDAEEEEEEE